MKTKFDHKSLCDFISDLPLFHGLDRREVDILADYMNVVELDAGQTLFNQWDRADYVCFIENGALNVMKKSSPDIYRPITTLERGRSIGEMSIIDNFPRSATVVARQSSRLILLYRDAFQRLMDEHNEIGVNILKGLARLLSLNLKKTSSRIADNMLPLG